MAIVPGSPCGIIVSAVVAYLHTFRIKLFRVTTNCLRTCYNPDSEMEHHVSYNENVIGLADKENSKRSL